MMQQQPQRYLALDSDDFRTALLFYLMAVAAIIALTICLVLNLADFAGVALGFLIMMLAGAAGNFTGKAIRHYSVSVTGAVTGGTTSAVPLLPGGVTGPLPDTGTAYRQPLSHTELHNRTELYDFLRQMYSGITGETRWYNAGMPREDYRTLTGLLAELGIIQKQQGTKPVTLVSFNECLAKIADHFGDADYWTEVVTKAVRLNTVYGNGPVTGSLLVPETEDEEATEDNNSPAPLL